MCFSKRQIFKQPQQKASVSALISPLLIRVARSIRISASEFFRKAEMKTFPLSDYNLRWHGEINTFTRSREQITTKPLCCTLRSGSVGSTTTLTWMPRSPNTWLQMCSLQHSPPLSVSCCYLSQSLTVPGPQPTRVEGDLIGHQHAYFAQPKKKNAAQHKKAQCRDKHARRCARTHTHTRA